MRIEINFPSITEENEPLRINAHTNSADAGMPHDSLTGRIDDLERIRQEIFRLVTYAIDDLGQMSCPLWEDGCPRCEARKRLEKIRILSDTNRRDEIC